jgi:hypothetical protein
VSGDTVIPGLQGPLVTAVISGRNSFKAHINHLGINLEPHKANKEEVDLIPTFITQYYKS